MSSGSRSEKDQSLRRTIFLHELAEVGRLWVPVPWPHGFEGPPEIDALATGTPPGQLDADKLELWAYVESFAAKPASLASARSPVFGKMSSSDWMRWGYLHTDHHLRQFYC
jgi:hypothetical protein